MPVRANNFSAIVDRLEAHYGRPIPPKTTDPFELILYENVAYLLNDQKRATAFEALRSRIGTRPTDILAATDDELLVIAKLGGMLPAARVTKLRHIALIALQEFEGQWTHILAQPFTKARKSLMKFPGIGEPGAEKILLFNRSYPVLALDSNCLRVLLRLGFGVESKNYAASYRSAQKAVKPQLKEDYDWLIRAYQLLRTHGQQLCRRSYPMCEVCPSRKVCPSYKVTTLPSRGEVGE